MSFAERDAGVPLSVCDIREEATAPYREGARVAASPRTTGIIGTPARS